MNNKKSPKRQKPLRTFSWVYKDHKTPRELLVEDTISEWYEAKHRTASNSEIDFINSILIKCCHHCSSSKIVKIVLIETTSKTIFVRIAGGTLIH